VLDTVVAGRAVIVAWCARAPQGAHHEHHLSRHWAANPQNFAKMVRA
jgi:hypothetical protein